MKLKNIILNFLNLIGKNWYSPYMDTYYFPKTDTIVMNKQKFFNYLKDWDESSDRQKAKQWEILNYLYDKKR